MENSRADKLDYISEKLNIRKKIQIAHYPNKKDANDACWEVTLISRLEENTDDSIGAVTIFDTGLKISCPRGYFVSVYTTPEFHRTGYMLPGPIVYQGEDIDFEIPLYKYKEASDLELPFSSGLMMALHKIHYCHMSGAIERKMPAKSRSTAFDQDDDDEFDHRRSSRQSRGGRKPNNKSYMF